MSDLKQKIGELAQLMEEFGLQDARMRGEGWSIAFSRSATVEATAVAPAQSGSVQVPPTRRSAAAAAPSGTPIASPMTGIYYSSPSPGAPAFVKEGDQVAAGQVVGLIEAMKVFNEITSTVSGTVLKIVADNGQLVNPGDPILFVG